ncbi:Tyrosinase [Arcticibacter svalbardensis MN12-7]|uniref:Tyrosinase n=1 Tax=Arcticibacter svalbardensis MN12-7 TaxID=1150600 RepID=R9GPF3_9SPHI|nr:tyrosinase family protein [Arcticibacter svalbardensis]EOR93425.1 Tyrosinase [Arcticibacter svalbardensis MN12-7]
MSINILINNSANPLADYVGWSPHPCQISSTDIIGQRVILKNLDTAKGGQVVFKKEIGDPVTDTLEIDIPNDSVPASFYISGKFDLNQDKGKASSLDKDCIIKIVSKLTNVELGQKALMVRVRKNANGLTDTERNKFLSAIVILNQQGKYIDFQNMHTSGADPEIHKRSSFLVWHRAYLLDFERKLQEIDPSVTIPYWKFDDPAPKVFNVDFMGTADASGAVTFSNTNPLVNWQPMIFGQGVGRIRRVAKFNTSTKAASNVKNNEAETLALGTAFATFVGTKRTGFCTMETDPHGSAHVSFTGQISDIGKAPADPLFFMLHSNVDRLWAKWQWIMTGQRFDPIDINAYPHLGSGNSTVGGEFGIGNFSDDTMWPWNGIFVQPRPITGPNTTFPLSPFLTVPSQTPDLKSMIDYHGQKNLSANLGFDYHGVRYDHSTVVV